MIRVLLADDQKLVREGWSVLLDHSSDISIVGQAKDGQEAVELARQLQPDIILMDVNMPRLDGLQATQRIVAQQPGIRVLMVTQSLDESLVRAALRDGAWGYLCKNDMFAELLPAVLSLHVGRSYFSQTIRMQYPRVVSSDRPPVWVEGNGPYEWRDSSWAYLCKELERWTAQARIFQDEARIVCQQSRVLRDRSRATRAFTHQLLRLQHPDVPALT